MILLRQVARRVDDDDVSRLLKMMVKSTGKRGVSQWGVISPLLSNIYLNEVDKMLEKAKMVTQSGRWSRVEYARFADDLVILLDAHPRHDWLRRIVSKRIREEISKLGLQVNEDKTRVVDLQRGHGFGFLGFQFHLIRSRAGRMMPLCTPQMKKRAALLQKLKIVFRRHESQPSIQVIEEINPILRGWSNCFRVGHSSRSFTFVRQWVEKKVRRHMMRAKKRRGFGWNRWSRQWLYKELGLYDDYQIRRVQS